MLRVIRSAAALVALYHLLPWTTPPPRAAVTMLLIGLAGFIALVSFQVRSPGRRQGPE